MHIHLILSSLAHASSDVNSVLRCDFGIKGGLQKLIKNLYGSGCLLCCWVKRNPCAIFHSNQSHHSNKTLLGLSGSTNLTSIFLDFFVVVFFSKYIREQMNCHKRALCFVPHHSLLLLKRALPVHKEGVLILSNVTLHRKTVPNKSTN